MPMTRKIYALFVLIAMLFGGSVFAQGQRPAPSHGSPKGGKVNERVLATPSPQNSGGGRTASQTAQGNDGQSRAGSLRQGSIQEGYSSQLKGPGLPKEEVTRNEVGDKLSKVEGKLETVLKEVKEVKSASGKIGELQTALQGAITRVENEVNKRATSQEGHPASPFPVPAWIPLGISGLSLAFILVVIIIAILIRLCLGQLNKRVADVNKCATDCVEKNQRSSDDINAAVAELRKSLHAQLKFLTDAVQAVDGKTGKLSQALKDIPRQLEAATKAMSRDVESHRGSLISCLFGRGKVSAPETGLTQQIEERIGGIEERIGQFQSAILAAVESDQKLQSRKVELDGHELRLKERENNLAAECSRAREEGAAVAERRAASFEAANKVLTDNMNAKAVEFGKRIATLEGERNMAKAAAQQAEAACAAAKSQADAAVKIREKLTEEVTRLSSEITKRDQARETELANAREEIRSKIEKAHADETATLRAEATSARAERDRAQKAVESLLAQKNVVDSELAAVKSSLDAEKAARENDRIAAERELAAEKAARESDLQKAEKEIAALASERDAAMSRVFPEEFREDADSQPLLAALDEWDARNVPGSALARASLAIFADRKDLPTKIWQRALGDLSLGIAAALDADKKSPADVATTLGQWKAVVEKRAGGNTSFSLKLPSIGSHVDTSWMHAKPGSAKVSRVRSWAVYGQAGNVYMAEVE